MYPLARGSGPLITVLCAVLLLQERPSAVAVVGALLIGCGAVLLTGNLRQRKDRGSLPAVGFALLTGLTSSRSATTARPFRHPP